MSTRFNPIEIPPGVSSAGTKNMRSSNWSEVNMIRWREGQLMPVGGQAQLIGSTGASYIFASRCKMIHGWHGLDTTAYIAYLCESNLYVDVGGILYDITPAGGMAAPSGIVGGYSDGPYNDSTYSTPRSLPGSILITKIPDAYSLDNFGTVLYAMTSADGRLLKWDPAAGPPGSNLAVVQPAASGRGPVPHGRSMVVTPDRFIMILGSTQDGTVEGGNFRRVAWCDQENPGAWDYTSVTSQAGFYDIEPASPIICGLASRLGVLIWTAQKTYVASFTGLPYVYPVKELTDGTTPWSPQSMVTTSSLCLWMSEQGVFSYDGTSVLPVRCMVRSWVDDDLDPILVRETSFAAHLAEFNEWWWFYPQMVNSGKNTRAIIYNYKEGWWSQVRMTRSAGITSSYTSHPIFADDFIAFQHEVGPVYGNADLPFAETFDLNLASGAILTTIKQMIPDIEGDVTNLRYSIFYRNSRSTGAVELQTVPRPVRDDGYVDFRTTGRDVRLRIEVATPIVNPFTIGQHLIDAVAKGDR